MPKDFIPLEDVRNTDSDFISLEEAKKQGWIKQAEAVAKDEGWGLKPSTWEDKFRNVFAAPIRSGMVTGGRAAGGAIGAPSGNPLAIGGGAVLGGIAGDQGYQILQRFFPRLFGAPENEGLIDSVNESATNTLLDYGIDRFIANPISSGISQSLTRSGRENLKNAFLTKFFNVNPNVPVQDALRASPGFDVDVSQATQSAKAKTIRDILFRQEALEEFSKQQGILNQEANQLLTTTAGKPTGLTTTSNTVAKRAANAAEGELLTLRAEEKAAYKKAEDVLIPKIKTQGVIVKEVPQDVKLYDPKGNQILPSTRNVGSVVDIKGPVYITQTSKKASEIVSDINQVINDPTNAMTTDPEALKALQGLVDKLNIFVHTPVDPKNSKQVISYESAKANKQYFSDFLKTAPETVKQRYVKSIEAMRNLISKDIHDTANTAWPAEAAEALNAAYRKTKARVSRFDNELARNLTSNDPDVIDEKILDSALSSVQKARQFKASVGSREELGTEYAKRILTSAQDNKGFFNGAKALENYYSSFDIAKEALNADQRKSFEYLMRRMQAVDPKLSEAGHIAFAIRHGGAFLGIGSGLIRGVGSLVSTGDISEAAQRGATTGAIVGGAFVGTVALTKPILKKLLFDPKNARIAAQLVSAPPQSSQAQILMRSLLKTAFKGAQIETQYGPYIVAPDGKLDPVKP
jgi:hypothetical protein